MARQHEVRYINQYVSGNIAYLPEEKTNIKKSVQLPKMKRKQHRQIAVDVFSLGAIALAVVLAVMMTVSLMQMNRAQEEAQILQNYVSTLQAENKELKDTYTSGYDLDEIRDIALTMGMVPIEEVPHLQMQVVVPQIEEEPTAWENFWAFMVGLFA